MGYAEETLTAGERILHKARFHWIYTAQAIAALVILIWVFGIGVLVFLAMMIEKWTTEIVITNQRLIYKRGWIGRKTDEISLSKIEEINFQQGPLGRLLGYGKLRIQGTGAGELILPIIDDPLTFRRGIDAARADPVDAFILDVESRDAKRTADLAKKMAKGRAKTLREMRREGFVTHVKIMAAQAHCCAAVRQLENKPIPIGDVPELPLDDCDQDYCRCVFGSHIK